MRSGIFHSFSDNFRIADQPTKTAGTVLMAFSLEGRKALPLVSASPFFVPSERVQLSDLGHPAC
jgi:hypothetical protein